MIKITVPNYNGLKKSDCKIVVLEKPGKKKKAKKKWISKKPSTPYSKAITRLDTVFSKFIRQRDSIGNNCNKCCTCGRIKKNVNRQIHAGHFQKRANMSTRYDEKNVHAQCNKCNTYEGGRDFEFGLYIDKKYGPGTAEKLYITAKVGRKYLRHELDKLTEYYKGKLNE